MRTYSTDLPDRIVAARAGTKFAKCLAAPGQLKSLTFRLWDEKLGRLVGFRHLRKIRKQRASGERKAEAQENDGDPHLKGR